MNQAPHHPCHAATSASGPHHLCYKKSAKAKISAPKTEIVKSACIGAVIIAAGQGLRMGRGYGHENGYCKPCMPLGSSTILANVMNCLQAGVTGPIVVVTGYHQASVEAEAARLGLITAHNQQPERGMLSSMQTGFAALLAMSDKLDGVFLLPADIPNIRPATSALLAEDVHACRAAITYPTFQGERGHPPILARHVVEQALSYEGQGGLRGLLIQIETNGESIRNVPVADEGILTDMDTVADHAQITAS